MDHKIRKAISDMELRRRWAETRKILREKDLEFLVTQGSNMHLGGYVRWFTDIPAEYNFHMTVLFPADDEMTLVRTSASLIPVWALRGVKEVLYAPFAPTLNYTSEIEIGLIEDYFIKRNPKRVGYIGTAMLTAGLKKALL